MEIADQVILFYPHERAEIYQLELIQSPLQALTAKGYYIFAEAEHEKVWPLWQKWNAATLEGMQTPSPLPAGISSQALAQVEQFCTEKQKNLSLHVLAVATEVYSKSGRKLLTGFEWSLGFDEEQAVIYTSYLRHHFTLLQDEWEAFPHWLEIVQLIYNTWHPIYGYNIDPRGGEKDTPREEILAHNISYLYDINLFGPEIAEKLGRERVESAPAQIITPLPDGGVMLVPCENLLSGFSQFSYSEVAKHLGLTAPTLSG